MLVLLSDLLILQTKLTKRTEYKDSTALLFIKNETQSKTMLITGWLLAIRGVI